MYVYAFTNTYTYIHIHTQTHIFVSNVQGLDLTSALNWIQTLYMFQTSKERKQSFGVGFWFVFCF